MRRLIFSRRARIDLESIEAYIVAESTSGLKRIKGDLASALERLPQFPEIGRVGVRPGTRELVTVRPYIVVYVVSDDAVEITSVWHAAQDR